MTHADDVSVRFRVDRVESGQLNVADVEVDYPDDARFLKKGTRYRVPVLRDAESDRFVSKVRPVSPERGGSAEECAKHDPVLTTLADGKPIDTGVFSGLHGRTGRAIWAFVIPTIAVLGALVVLVLVKRAIVWTFNRTVAR